MKKENKLGKNLIEALIEIVFGGIFLFIGYIVLKAFRVDFTLLDTDPELLMLIGFLLVFAVFLIVMSLVYIIKRKKQKKKSDTEEESEKNERDYFFEFDNSAD